MKNSFQLVNQENQSPLDIRFGDSNSSTDTWNYTDWDIDGNGNLKMITNDEQRVQSALKCIFTERQSNGYGSKIYSLIGEKDIIVRRMSLFMDLTMAIMSLKLFNDEQKDIQNFEDEDLIETMTKLIVTEDSTDPTTSKIQLALKSSSTITNIGVL